MAGNLYLGSNKVCPAILVGQPEPPEYDVLLKVPDGVTSIQMIDPTDQTKQFFNFRSNVTGNEPEMKVLVDLNNLEYAGRFTFRECIWVRTDAIKAELKADKLKTADAYCFAAFLAPAGVSSTKSYYYNQTVDFKELEVVNAYALTNFVPPGLKNIYFRKLKTVDVNGFYRMIMPYSTGVTLHFPSNMETTIQGLTGYPLFGGTSGEVTLVFDQPPVSLE